MEELSPDGRMNASLRLSAESLKSLGPNHIWACDIPASVSEYACYVCSCQVQLPVQLHYTACTVSTDQVSIPFKLISISLPQDYPLAKLPVGIEDIKRNIREKWDYEMIGKIYFSIFQNWYFIRKKKRNEIFIVVQILFLLPLARLILLYPYWVIFWWDRARPVK